MVSVSVKIDPKTFEEFQKACVDFAIGLNTGTHDVAIAQAHHICMDAMRFTPPMRKGGGGGLKNPAKMMGEGAVKADINSMAISADNRSAAFMMYRQIGTAAYRNDRGHFDRVINLSTSTLKTVKNSIMIKIANDPDHERAFKKARNLFAKTVPHFSSDNVFEKIYSDLKEPHEKLKTRYNGRKIRKKLSWINKYVTDYQYAIDKEYERSKKNVGALKAGWFKAKQGIPKMLTRVVKKPGGTIPAWVSRHGGANGLVNYNYTGRTLNLSVINLIGDNNNVATEADTKNIVYGNRVKQMPAELQHILTAQVEKFNKKQLKKNGN